MKKVIICSAVLGCLVAPLRAEGRGLTSDERVAAQKAIEQVNWNHRIWPKENTAPKPPLSAVMSDGAIRAKVADYLEKSNALEKRWQRPITAEQLQAELDRMAKNTRDGATLQELYRALGNDPFVIAETLARPALAERLIRNWYANDARFHDGTKAKAEAALAACTSAGCMKSMPGEYHETTWKRRADRGPHAPNEKDTAFVLEPEDWADTRERLARKLGGSAQLLPIGRVSALEETSEAFVVTAVLAQREDEMTTASVAWPKRSFDAWWDAERAAVSSGVEKPSGTFALANAPSTTCTNDTWRPTRLEVPDERWEHTAVWTGTEMIVWGGTNGSELNTGARYNPATDTWTPTSTGANVPAERDEHTAVWTGAEMIVWGGANGSELNTGGRYNPSTDTWTPTSTGANVPSARAEQTAIWTGAEMIVWGGSDGSELNTGGRYNPSTDTWMATSTGANVPVARVDHTAVWTGTQMVVWGGDFDSYNYLNTGGRYNPSTDTWTATSTGANAPPAHGYPSSVWTGTEMIIWGGYNTGSFYLKSGARYNPSTNTWTPTSTGANVPAARYYQSSVWTGTEMILWGGFSGSSYLNSGGRYNPSNNTWVATSTGASVPVARYSHSAVWTGTEMIVWGGVHLDGVTAFPSVSTGGRYNPATDSWTPTAMGANAPAGRHSQSALWTGTQMVIWGGTNDRDYFNTGGRYNPSTNTWTPTSTGVNVPAAQAHPAAVWTGTEMIVWGGYNPETFFLNTGGRYNPVTDSWAPTSTGANVPAAREDHSAVWTGTEMIVWGGSDGTEMNTGGRYNPSTDMWTATSTGANGPAARIHHTAVWTGARMVVWGGTYGGSVYFNTGARYDPSTDGWTATSTGANVPAEHGYSSAVWTGAEMIVWGGYGPDVSYLDTGGSYNPSVDNWAPTSLGENVPAERYRHTAVWTGTGMLVWGGYPLTASGAVYCACPDGLGVFYRDADGDGHGNAALTESACARPAGYVIASDDCNDADPTVYSGAPELNDGVDNQCPGQPGYGSVDEIGDTIHVDSGGVVCWTDSSAALTYDVARSPNRDLSPCQIIASAAGANPCLTDPAVPSPGGALYYVVRAASPHLGSWGQSSTGAERLLSCP